MKVPRFIYMRETYEYGEENDTPEPPEQSHTEWQAIDHECTESGVTVVWRCWIV